MKFRSKAHGYALRGNLRNLQYFFVKKDDWKDFVFAFFMFGFSRARSFLLLFDYFKDILLWNFSRNLLQFRTKLSILLLQHLQLAFDSHLSLLVLFDTLFLLLHFFLWFSQLLLKPRNAAQHLFLLRFQLLDLWSVFFLHYIDLSLEFSHS